MLVDSHCHLNFPELYNDLAGVLNRAKSEGVGLLQTISTTLSEFPTVLAIAERHHIVYCSVGIHPVYTAAEAGFTAQDLILRCNHEKVIAIGETGLDYYREPINQKLQYTCFIEHIIAAQETGLPVIIHTRHAERDTLAILQQEIKHKPFTGVIHCFTASKWLADACIELGLYISASGIITFKNAHDIQRTFTLTPIEKIIIETDAPFLAPIPKRGQYNEPSYLHYTAQSLAELKGIRLKQLIDITTANFFRLFGKVSISAGKFSHSPATTPHRA